MTLSEALHTRCRATLLKCDKFNSDESLRSIFVTPELSIYRNDLPDDTTSKEDRVSKTINYLLQKRLSGGRPVFPLFIAQLRGCYQEGDALRDDLDKLYNEVEQAKSIEIRFVVAAMTSDEATALVKETAFDNPAVAPADRDQFRKFRKTLQQHGVDDWQSSYGKERECWRPQNCQQNTIRKIIEDTVEIFNQQRSERPGLPLINPVFCSSKFFSENQDTRIDIWDQLSWRGCVVIIDAVSMFHPQLRRMVSSSQMGSNERVAMLTFSPVNFSEFPVNKLIEEHIRSQMKRAFARFDKYLDKLCEFGIGDLRAIQRWLFVALPEAAEIVEGRRPNPSSRRAVRKMRGEARGVEQVIFGQRGLQ